jgi:hypothetical protein
VLPSVEVCEIVITGEKNSAVTVLTPSEQSLALKKYPDLVARPNVRYDL